MDGFVDKEFLSQFKDNPKKAVKRLIDSGRLERDPETISNLLLYTDGLDDTAVGDYIGDGDELCGKVLHHYVGTFNFTGLGFDDALRKFLSAFRLPGEAQKIERIMDAFAAQFHRNNPRAFRHPDTAFKLAYSVIMLNTDAHNPAIKQSRKMTKEQFVRNNRGLDDGHDLPQEFLEIIHDRIVANEIKMQPYKNDAGDKSILAYTNPHKAGWLKKESGRFKNWKELWFILKDSCLYYLRKPPVWGADCELCGHIPLHANLVAREAEQCQVVLEMRNRQMLKCGKIDKRQGSMRTIQLPQLRLLASSQSESSEWALAINNNVMSLVESRSSLPSINIKVNDQTLDNSKRWDVTSPIETNWKSEMSSYGIFQSTSQSNFLDSEPPQNNSIQAHGAINPFNLLAHTEGAGGGGAGAGARGAGGAGAGAGGAGAGQSEAIGTEARATMMNEGESGGGGEDSAGGQWQVFSSDESMNGEPGKEKEEEKRTEEEDGSMTSMDLASPLLEHSLSVGMRSEEEEVPARKEERGRREEVDARKEPVAHRAVRSTRREEEHMIDVIGDVKLEWITRGGVRQDSGFRERMRSFISAHQPWPYGLVPRERSGDEDEKSWREEGATPQLTAVYMAMAGFTFEPDEDYKDRVVCNDCGLSVGAWEIEDDPMQAHVEFVSDGSGSLSCPVIQSLDGNYKALRSGDIRLRIIQHQDGSESMEEILRLSPQSLRERSPETGSLKGWPSSSDLVDDAMLEEALSRYERSAQRLVVEQQYGQRLEALTSSLISKIQSWMLRLSKEEALRDQLKLRLDRLQQAQLQTSNGDNHLSKGKGPQRSDGVKLAGSQLGDGSVRQQLEKNRELHNFLV